MLHILSLPPNSPAAQFGVGAFYGDVLSGIKSFDWNKKLPQPKSIAYQVVDIEGKGKGVVATRDIDVGEIILIERPLLVYPRMCRSLASKEQIDEAIEKMTVQNREAFQSLSNSKTKAEEDNNNRGIVGWELHQM